MDRIVLIDRCIDCGWIRFNQNFFCGLTYLSIAKPGVTEMGDLMELPIPDHCPLREITPGESKPMATRHTLERSYSVIIARHEKDAVTEELWELRDGTLWLGEKWGFSAPDLPDSYHSSSPYTQLDLREDDFPGWALDDYLRSHGYDPEAVGRNLRAVAEKILSDLKKGIK